MITVCCFLWDDAHAKQRHVYRYRRDHVHMLQAQVRRNLAQPHRFVVVTDQPDAFGDGIETATLDKRTHRPGKRTAKLMLFRRDIAERLGDRILYMDLDTVVVGERPQWAPYNSSVILLSAGTHPHIYDTFNPLEPIRTPWSSDDQDWISMKAPTAVAAWDHRDGIWNQSRLPRTGGASSLPEGARLVCFPGPREPGLLAEQRDHPWIVEHRR
jgi:hypothetical protein